MKQIKNRSVRVGFTLSELLVVLGLLVAIMALAQPALRGSLGDSRLRSAGKLIRVELAKARLKAMQSGVTQQFRYQPGKGNFEIAPASKVSANERGSARSARERDRLVEQAEKAGQPAAVELCLPEGISFDDRPVESPTTAIAEEGWSDPIVFYPNGRTATAHIRLNGERNAFVEVSLRGLTGVATASRPRHEEEMR